MAANINKVTSFICRICLLGTQDKYFSLFEPFKDYSPAYHINSITKIHINEEDTLPGKICTTCLLDLENAINFKIKCENSDAYLRQILDESVETSETYLPNLELPDCNEVIVKEEKYGDSDFLEDSLDEGIYDKEDNSSPYNNNTNNKKRDQECDISDDVVKVNVDVPSKCPVTCHDCGGVFKSKCKLRVHWKTEHKIYLDCELCKARFCSMKAYKNHKLTSTERCKLLNTVTINGFGKNRIYTCPTCKYSTNRAVHILQHLPIHTGERKYVCSICGKAYMQRNSLISHKESIHQSNKVVSKCDICCKVIEGRCRFNAHMKSVHSKRIFQCDICHKIVKSKATMVNHLRVHKGVKSFSCEFCGKNFVNISNLANHKGYCHFNTRDRKQFSCSLCDYKSPKKHTMDGHVARHGDDGISCEICGKFFKSELRLWIHKLCHLPTDSVARRTCQICGQVFLRNKSMVYHVRTIHIKKGKGTYNLNEVISRVKTELTHLNSATIE